MRIEEMTSGLDNVSFEAIIAHVTVGKTNGANKSNYLNLVLQDDSGSIDAKLWAARQEQIETFTQGTVVKGQGDIINYNNSRQMKVIKLEKLEKTEVEKTAYLIKAPIDREILAKDLERALNSIGNTKLYTLTKALYEEHKEAFQLYPAATSNHHEFVSGLLYHTICMIRLGEAVADIYQDLNRDLLIAGIILHDIGKIVELSGPVTPTYTVEGNLLGHISIGNAMIAQKAAELGIDGEELVLLQHMILSHHGKNEYGSPILPQIKEAEVLSFIDNIDARINMFNKALDTIEPGHFSKRVFALENRSVYKPHE